MILKDKLAWKNMLRHLLYFNQLHFLINFDNNTVVWRLWTLKIWMFKERIPCKSSGDFEKFCASKALLTSKDENMVFGHFTLKTLSVVISEQGWTALNLWGGEYFLREKLRVLVKF